jgi:hypothetical protein
MEKNKGWRSLFQEKPYVAAGALFLILFAVIAVPWVLLLSFPSVIESFYSVFSTWPPLLQMLIASPFMIWFILQAPALLIPSRFFPGPYELPDHRLILNTIINAAICALFWTLLVYFIHSLLTRRRLTTKEK